MYRLSIYLAFTAAVFSFLEADESEQIPPAEPSQRQIQLPILNVAPTETAVDEHWVDDPIPPCIPSDGFAEKKDYDNLGRPHWELEGGVYIPEDEVQTKPNPQYVYPPESLTGSDIGLPRLAPLPYLDILTRRFAIRMERDQELYWRSARGMHAESAHSIEVTFDHYHARTVEEARALLVYAVRGFLDMMDEGGHQPQLGHFPFEPEDITITINFDSFFGFYIDRAYVESLTMRNGIICYRSFNCRTGSNCFTRRERWDQAAAMEDIYKDVHRQSITEADLEDWFNQAILQKAAKTNSSTPSDVEPVRLLDPLFLEEAPESPPQGEFQQLGY